MASVKVDFVAENLNAGIVEKSKIKHENRLMSLNDCLKIEFILTCIGNFLTIIDELEQILHFKNQNQQNKNDDGCHGAHINGLCVFDKCFSTVKSEFEIKNHK